MKERVLIVDDEAPVRELLAGVLSLAGYQVDQAGSADEGLAKIGQRPYNLLLTDLRLPGMSGLQFLAATHRLDPACGRLIITGYGPPAPWPPWSWGPMDSS
ncbi:MAG: response regulator [Dehalococcoidia bacterium]|nr:response regulator [Dehalococcoidia bacterium]